MHPLLYRAPDNSPVQQICWKTLQLCWSTAFCLLSMLIKLPGMSQSELWLSSMESLMILESPGNTQQRPTWSYWSAPPSYDRANLAPSFSLVPPPEQGKGRRKEEEWAPTLSQRLVFRDMAGREQVVCWDTEQSVQQCQLSSDIGLEETFSSLGSEAQYSAEIQLWFLRWSP